MLATTTLRRQLQTCYQVPARSHTAKETKPTCAPTTRTTACVPSPFSLVLACPHSLNCVLRGLLPFRWRIRTTTELHRLHPRSLHRLLLMSLTRLHLRFPLLLLLLPLLLLLRLRSCRQQRRNIQPRPRPRPRHLLALSPRHPTEQPIGTTRVIEIGKRPVEKGRTGFHSFFH